jgi:hypothetical protein
MNNLLLKFKTVVGCIGGFIAYLVGGFTSDITTLII